MKKLKKLHIKEKIEAFRHWQQQPHQVDPMSEEHHVCHTCETEYQGNFCPRCGQSAKIGRYSFKSAFLSFLDVWGLGNRGMFRTLRDLLLRPGYMIRDYIKGMQMAYFPPFQMFFLFATLSLFVANGLNIKGQRAQKEIDREKKVNELVVEQNKIDENEGLEGSDSYSVGLHKTIVNTALIIKRFSAWSPALFAFSLLLFLSGFLYMFFRHSPNIPDLSYSEFFVAIIYTTNMYTIFSIVFDFFCLERLGVYALSLTLIPLKQLSGYSWKRIFLFAIVAILNMLTVFLFAIAVMVFVLVIMFKDYDSDDIFGMITVVGVLFLTMVGFYFLIRRITRENLKLQQSTLHRERLRKVRTTIWGRVPKRKGKVPPTPSEI